MTNPLNFKQGDTVYSEHGEEAEFIALSMGECLVRPIYEDGDYGPCRGEATTWKAVFHTPPKPKLDAETAAAEKNLSDLRAEINKLRDERRAMDVDQKERIERIKLHDELKDLDDFLSGKITHYVTVSPHKEVEIVAIEDTITSDSYSDYGMLKLYPRRGWNKQIFWTVTWQNKDRNRYYDSRTSEVIPCCGYPAALDTAKAFVAQLAATVLEKKETYSFDRAIAQCKRYEVECPQELIDLVATRQRASLEAQIKEHQTKLDAYKAQLAAL